MRPFALWFIVSLVVRLLYLAEQQSGSVLFYQQLLDEEEMRRAAEGLLAGHGFGPEPLFKAPLYPIYLAAVMLLTGDAWPFAARLLQHLGGALLVVLAADTVTRLLAPGRARTVAMHTTAALLAFNAPLVRLEHQLLLDFPAVLLQSAMMWALVRGIVPSEPVVGVDARPCSRRRMAWLAGAGVLAAAAWLTRPTITPVLPALVVAMGLLFEAPARTPRRVAARLAVFLAAPLLAVALFTARNAVVSGEALWLPWQGGYNLYESNKRGATGRYLEQSQFAVSSTGNPTQTIMLEAYERETFGSEHRGPISFGAVDRMWRNRAIAEVRAAPGAWVALYARKLLYLLNDREIYNVEVFDVQRRESPILTYAAPVTFGLVLPLALASFAFWPFANWGRRRAALLLLVYTVTIAAAIALYYASGRLRAPLYFPIAVFAGVGVGRCVAMTNKVAMRRALAVALALLGVAIAWGDWAGVRSERLDYIEYERLSNAASRAGEYQRALDYADRAAAASSEAGRSVSTAMPSLRAQALFGLDRFDEAAAEFERAAAVQPLDPIAPFNRGWIALFREHDAEAALPWLEQATARNPEYARAWAVYGLALIKAGRVEDASTLFTNGSSANDPPEAYWFLLARACARGDRAAAVATAQQLRAQRGDAALATMAEELGPLGLDGCLKQAP